MPKPSAGTTCSVRRAGAHPRAIPRSCSDAHEPSRTAGPFPVPFSPYATDPIFPRAAHVLSQPLFIFQFSQRYKGLRTFPFGFADSFKLSSPNHSLHQMKCEHLRQASYTQPRIYFTIMNFSNFLPKFKRS